MTEPTTNQAALNMVRAARKASKTVVTSTLAAEMRNIQFGQSVLASGIEIARRQAESTVALAQTLAGQAQHPRAAFQAVVDSAVTTEVRTFQFAQNVFEQWTAVLKAHTEGMQTLAQELFEQSQEQQAAFRTFAQEVVNASVNSFGTITR